MQASCWICFEIRFTLTWFRENLKNSTKSLKVAFNMKKKQKYFSCFFDRLFDCHKVNFGSLSTFAPWKGWKRKWKIYFLVKNGFSVNIFDPNMVAFLNSGCNISMRASVHLWKFVSSSQGYQKYSRRFFYICQKASWKNVIVKPSIPWKMLNLLESYYMVLRLYSLIVPSSQVITTPV